MKEILDREVQFFCTSLLIFQAHLPIKNLELDVRPIKGVTYKQMSMEDA